MCEPLILRVEPEEQGSVVWCPISENEAIEIEMRRFGTPISGAADVAALLLRPKTICQHSQPLCIRQTRTCRWVCPLPLRPSDLTCSLRSFWHRATLLFSLPRMVHVPTALLIQKVCGWLFSPPTTLTPSHREIQCVCMCVCMYVCMYVWMNEWMNVCMYVCMYVCMSCLLLLLKVLLFLLS